jgi:hypothetical protein
MIAPSDADGDSNANAATAARARRRHASAAALAAASATAARLAREAELEDRMLRQQQETLAGDGAGWEPKDWRWRPLVAGGGGGAVAAPAASTTDADARAAVAAYARASDDLDAPLRGLRLIMGSSEDEEPPPLALLAFLRRGLDEACEWAAAAAAVAEPSSSSSSPASPPVLRILVLGGGAPLALAAAAAATAAAKKQAAARVALVEPSPWGRRAARRLLLAAGASSGAEVTVVASTIEVTALWQSQPAHVLVTDLFADGGGAPFALGLLPALAAARASGAADPSSTAFVPFNLRLRVALASARVATSGATFGVDLSALDEAYRWSPPGSGGFASGGGSGARRPLLLSQPFVAAEFDLAAVGDKNSKQLSCKTTRVEADKSGACNACLVWAEPVLRGAAGAGATATAPSSSSSIYCCSASLWHPSHRPLPLEKGERLLVRATVASGRPAALDLEFCDDDDDDGGKGGGGRRCDCQGGKAPSLALVRRADARPPCSSILLDRPLRGAVLPSWHLEMVMDKARNQAYAQAIGRAVQGAAARAASSAESPARHIRVLDVGSGSGLLSIFAAR